MIFETKQELLAFLEQHRDLLSHVTFHYAEQSNGTWLIVF